jgi:hypothetical protein
MVTGIIERAVGAAGQGTIAAHAGAANARGIATIKNRLNIDMFFISLGQPPSTVCTRTSRLTELHSESVLHKSMTYKDQNTTKVPK